MKAGNFEKSLHVEGDSYKRTVLALRALANEILFDDKKRIPVESGTVRCGRKMTTSDKNRHSKQVIVTPDLVTQAASGSGVLAECKWGVAGDSELFAKQIQGMGEQIEKYDDDLVGWPIPNSGEPDGEGTVANHDLILLVNHEDSKRVARELARRVDDGRLQVRRNFAIIGMGKFERAGGVWYELDLEYGKLTDPSKTEKLYNRLQIEPVKLEINPWIALKQLCDYPPPVPVMMELVLKAIIQNLSRDENEKHRLDGELRKTVSMNDVCKWISVFAFPQLDHRDSPCPQKEWVSIAMSKFVAMKWAEACDGKSDEWVFIHKRGRKEPYIRFIRFCAREMLLKEMKVRKLKKQEQKKKAAFAAREAAKKAKKAETAKKKKGMKIAKEKERNPLFADHIQDTDG